MENKEIISVKILINASIIKVWNFWTEPKHIMNWNNASEDWQAILDSFKKYVESN